MEIIDNLFIRPRRESKLLAGCIALFHDAFPTPADAVKVFESLAKQSNGKVDFFEATVGAGTATVAVNKNIRSNSHLNLTKNAIETEISDLQDIHNAFRLLLLESGLQYRNLFHIHESYFHEDYIVLRYQTGEEYKAHYDGSTITGRFLSAIAYLNDDYEGGELEFPNFGVKIKPRAGDLLLFPSNYAYAHIAHPVTSGTKYAIVTWIHDRPGSP